MNNLEGWDVEEQQKRAIFMDHCYKVYGRDNEDHPMHACTPAGKSSVSKKLVMQCVIASLK